MNCTEQVHKVPVNRTTEASVTRKILASNVNGLSALKTTWSTETPGPSYIFAMTDTKTKPALVMSTLPSDERPIADSGSDGWTCRRQFTATIQMCEGA